MNKKWIATDHHYYYHLHHSDLRHRYNFDKRSKNRCEKVNADTKISAHCVNVYQWRLHVFMGFRMRFFRASEKVYHFHATFHSRVPQSLFDPKVFSNSQIHSNFFNVLKIAYYATINDDISRPTDGIFCAHGFQT